jgi:hypothetical protein
MKTRVVKPSQLRFMPIVTGLMSRHQVNCPEWASRIIDRSVRQAFQLLVSRILPGPRFARNMPTTSCLRSFRSGMSREPFVFQSWGEECLLTSPLQELRSKPRPPRLEARVGQPLCGVIGFVAGGPRNIQSLCRHMLDRTSLLRPGRFLVCRALTRQASAKQDEAITVGRPLGATAGLSGLDVACVWVESMCHCGSRTNGCDHADYFSCGEC